MRLTKQFKMQTKQNQLMPTHDGEIVLPRAISPCITIERITLPRRRRSDYRSPTLSYNGQFIEMMQTQAPLELPHSLPVINDRRHRPMPKPLSLVRFGTAQSSPNTKQALVIGGRHTAGPASWPAFIGALDQKRDVYTFNRPALLAEALAETPNLLQQSPVFDEVFIQVGNDEPARFYTPNTYAGNFYSFLTFSLSIPHTDGKSKLGNATRYAR